MPVDSNVFDAIVRNRVDVLRWAEGEARTLVSRLAEEDAKVADLLRRRLGRVKAGDPRSPSAKALAQDLADLRRDSLREIRDEIKAAMQEFATREATIAQKILSDVVGVDFDAATVAGIKAALAEPFAMGHGVARTLNQWADDVVRGDRSRVTGAIQAGIRSGESVESIVRRVVGTRSSGFSDGLLAQTRRNLDALVRTAVDHAANAALEAVGRANADDGAVIGFVWSAILDGHVCVRCSRQNGRFVPIGDRRPPRGMKLVDRQYRRGPPAHGRCRCSLVPVFDKRALAARIREDS